MLEDAEKLGERLGDFILRTFGIKQNTYIGNVPVTIKIPKSKKITLGQVALYKAELALLQQRAVEGDWDLQAEDQWISIQAILNDCYVETELKSTFEGDKVWADGKHLDPSWPPDQQIWGMIKIKAYREGLFEGVPLDQGGIEKINTTDFRMLGINSIISKSLVDQGLTISDLREENLVVSLRERILDPLNLKL